jgi:glycosyltransferase involved in cell wall biosynthesis
MILRDYKVLCASYLLKTEDKICEACKNEKYYKCFFEKCVKNSRMKSFLNMVEMYLHHKILHIYNLVNVFISPSRFLKSKLEEMGFKGKIVFLPNFADIDTFVPRFDWDENSIVYYGRLIAEKGLFTLIDAVKDIDNIC